MIPRISVVLPVRNAEVTLDAALRSCREQTFSDLEVLVVLNGCTDRSEEIAQRHAGEDDRIRVLHSAEEGGVVAAQQCGVQAARAGLIARMDADDVSGRERLGRQWEALERNPHWGAVTCKVRLIEGQGEGMRRYVDWVNSLQGPGDVARERFVECPVIQPSLLMRRAALEGAGGYRSTEWAEDHDLVLRMLGIGVQIGTVPEVLLDWRDGPLRLTRSHPMYADEQVWRLKAHHLARLDPVAERGVAICGAGPIGKRLGTLLRAGGVTQHGFFEVNRRRVGQRIGGVPVAGPQEFGTRWCEAVLLSAVGVPGGRERVRTLALDAGYREGANLWCCC